MDIKPLAKTPLINNTDKATWNWFVELGNRINQLITKANSAITIPAHKTTHATGGSDVLTPADIGAASKTQEVWQAPTLLNSWVNYGDPFPPVGYYKDTIGVVHLRGTVKSGTSGVPIFNLPSGYRPAYRPIFSCSSNSTIATVEAFTTGEVEWISGGSNAYLSLDGISFRAEA